MKNLCNVICLSILFIAIDPNTIQGSFHQKMKKYNNLSHQKKMKLKNLLMNDVYALRSIKNGIESNPEFLDLKKQFTDALVKERLIEIEALLNKNIYGAKINANKAVYFKMGKEKLIRATPLVFAATIKANLPMVKILLYHKAFPSCYGHSLIYKMLQDLNKNEFFWAEATEKTDQGVGAFNSVKFRKNFLSILEYLLQYCSFNKSNDEENCENLWNRILDRVNSENNLGSHSLDIMRRIDSRFFLTNKTKFHKKSNLHKSTKISKSKEEKLLDDEDDENLDLTQQFAKAVIAKDIKKVKSILMKTDINLDEEIQYNNGHEIICESPMVIAIIKNIDLKMVKLFVQMGKSIDFPENLICKMLNTFVRKSYCINEQNFDDELEKNLANFFEMVKYLLTYWDFKFDKNEEAVKIADIWSKIVLSVDKKLILLKGIPLNLMLEITDVFFKQN